MNTLHFVALVRGTQQAGYTARFPDLPECSARGADVAGLVIEARRAVLDHLQALSDAGEAWPKATPIEQIAVDAGVIAVLIDVAADDPPIRVNVSLGERLVQRLDAAAEARGMTRSGFIAQSVRMSLGEQPRHDFEGAGRKLQDDFTALARKINEAIGPNSVFEKRMADLDDRFYDGVRRAADSVSAAMARRREASKTTGGTAAREADAPE
ncbi:type II toxin-antitoxin system HicB family antitoxin [Phenylobacterium sp.]|jgi:predicted RNase H-like HicB family nuclease|uniref:type II toxin-antitoxin system HicB family antitoxin n=1 Tax=Phenylobacterium sp. TaxID=1871053 RepID=UPI002E35E6C8|nr:type II toxin-antitoxin system HicB family antitoxin [Phenylobacterium sp.]HEX3367632.1 type II toxin-antitoxin system HicB family antitoxin [Phenylobacterium sp.]